jgi:Spherulation-specific family 4
MRSTATTVVVCVVALVGAVGVWVGQKVIGAGSSSSHQQIGLPAYWTPDAAGAARFNAVATALDAAGAGGVVVVNGPTSSAPVPLDPATAAQIRKLRRARGTVLGYVDTGFLGGTGHVTTRVRPGSTQIADWTAQAIGDARAWVSLYGASGLSGIFLDQAPSACGDANTYVDVYRELVRAVRELLPGAFVALNPGTVPAECYAEVADTIVIFENTYAEYRSWAPPSWVSRYPRRRFWHLVHATRTPAEMRTAIDLSKRRHAGYVYVTNDTITAMGSPWGTLPPWAYWEEELRRIRGD